MSDPHTNLYHERVRAMSATHSAALERGGIRFDGATS
jgi:hypothetical protein